MGRKPRKALVIGLDAPIPEVILRYAKEGVMPAVGRLIETGVFAENCMCPFPTITPPNWTTIVTGATLGTHGITCFHVHNPGDPLDQVHQGFDTGDCHAEYIWNAAEQAGVKSIVFNYPSSWPPTLKHGWQIGGMGLAPNEQRVGGAWATPLSLCDCQLFATDDLARANALELRPADGWQNLPASRHSLEAELALRYQKAGCEVEPVTWRLALLDTEGKGFDTVVVSESKDGAQALATLRVGEWSDTVVRTFNTAEGAKRAGFRLKLVSLSFDGTNLRLFVTALANLDPACYPEGLTQRLEVRAGLPLPSGPEEAHTLGWIDADTFVDYWNMAHEWYADTVVQLFDQCDWTLLLMHDHCPDWIYHRLMNRVDPISQKDPEVRREAERIIRGCHEGIDRMIGKIVEAAGEEVLVIVVSDHGVVPTTSHGFVLPRILREAGLTVLKTDPETSQEVVDWSKTKAVAQRSSYVYVNVRGRDPEGVVEYGEEYEQVRNQIIAALYDFVDPETGQRPVTLALRREDARVLGLFGDYVGDVVVAIGAPWGHEHGQQLPTAELGSGQMKSLCIFNGPGVKQGMVMHRTMNLTDIVPTLCYLMDLPVPAQCEGAIVYQALEDPNIQLTQRKQLEDKCTRLEELIAQEEASSHSYHRAGA